MNNDAVRIDELARTLADIFGQEWGGISGEPSLDWDDDQISEDDREMWRTVVSRFIAAAGIRLAPPGTVAVERRDVEFALYQATARRDELERQRRPRGATLETIARLDAALGAGGPDGEGE